MGMRCAGRTTVGHAGDLGWVQEKPSSSTMSIQSLPSSVCLVGESGGNAAVETKAESGQAGASHPKTRQRCLRFQSVQVIGNSSRNQTRGMPSHWNQGWGWPSSLPVIRLHNDLEACCASGETCTTAVAAAAAAGDDGETVGSSAGSGTWGWTEKRLGCGMAEWARCEGGIEVGVE